MSEWKEVKLGEIARSNQSTYSPKDNWKFANYLDTGNITENRISKILFIDLMKEDLPSRARRKVRKNSIIYSTVRPNQKHFGIIKNIPENFLVSTGFSVLDVDESKANPDFVYYSLIQEKNTASLQAVAEQSTSAYPAIKPSDIENLPIKLPPLAEQQRIAEILGSLDDKIELNNRINRNLEEQAQALFKNWFVDFAPFGGVMPADWRKGTLADIAEIKKRAFHPEKNPGLIVEHYSLPALDEKHYPVFEVTDGIKSGKFIVSKESVLISKLNPDIKRIWRPYCISEHPICSTEFVVFEAKENFNHDYLYSIIDSNQFYDFMCSLVTGSTNSHQRVSPNALLAYALPIPAQKVLKSFCDKITPIYEMIEKNALENQQLTTLRDTLLPKLISGEKI